MLEYDGAQLRGLDPGYTQILINGKKVPGAGDDRSFFVDRIPAELVEHIEIVRSTSANRSGDAVAGALNIVLRDAYAFDGGYVRAGGLRFDDGEVKPTFGAVDQRRSRRRPPARRRQRAGPLQPEDKAQRPLRPRTPDGDLVNREDQTDTRDGSDYSANLPTRATSAAGRLRARRLLRADRPHRDRALAASTTTRTSDRAATTCCRSTTSVEDIDQENWSLGAELRVRHGRRHAPSSSSTTPASMTTRAATEERESASTTTRRRRSSTSAKARARSPTRATTRSSASSWRTSATCRRRRRWSSAWTTGQEPRHHICATSDESMTDEEGERRCRAYDEFDRSASRIEETRVDPYLMFSRQGAARSRGKPACATRPPSDRRSRRRRARPSRQRLRRPAAVGAPASGPHQRRPHQLLGGAHRASPELQPASCRSRWRRSSATTTSSAIRSWIRNAPGAWTSATNTASARSGVVGVNVFYRDVKDLIEIVNTGEPSATALDDYEDEVEEFLDEQPRRDAGHAGLSAVRSGQLRLHRAQRRRRRGLRHRVRPVDAADRARPADTGVFVNYSWLDSCRRRVRRAPLQQPGASTSTTSASSRTCRDWGVSFGASYRSQGDAFARMLGEEVTTTLRRRPGGVRREALRRTASRCA